jgi:hypothetical protein
MAALKTSHFTKECHEIGAGMATRRFAMNLAAEVSFCLCFVGLLKRGSPP